MSKYRICAIVPCWKRPARTRRIINNILAQNINNWEAFVLGDGCPVYNTLIESGEAKFYQDLAESKGNKLHMFNFEEHHGGYGHYIINYCIERNNSNYVIILGNDDVVTPNHFRHYLSEIENTEYEMVAYKTCAMFLPDHLCMRPLGFPAEAGSNVCMPGHGEIIIKSDVARLFTSNPNYGHDWDLVTGIYNRGKAKMANSENVTYFITHSSRPPIHPDVPIRHELID